MKKIFFISLLVGSLNYSYAQIKYEPGYFIANNGDTTYCLIKNVDWENNPKEFSYQLTENATSQSGKIDEVKEFSINSGAKYKRFTTNIDTSSDQMSTLSSNPSPEFRTEQLFLKVLVEGKATLFYFKGNGLTRFFYSKSDSIAKQLIYKEYLARPTSIAKNETFRQQILLDMSCPKKITEQTIQKLSYKKGDLINFFNLYNKCIDPSFVGRVENNTKAKFFHLRIRPGLSSSSLVIFNNLSDNTDFGSKANIRFGIESEFILHFNKNKWAILLEPVFQYFKSTVAYGNKTAVADIKAIEFSGGVRHYFFLNDFSAIFVNGSYILGVPLGSSIITQKGVHCESGINTEMSFGAGYVHKKYSFEIRYVLPRDILSSYFYLHSNYKVLSAIFGYKLF